MNALLRRLLGLGDVVPPRRTFHLDDGRTLDVALDADGQPEAPGERAATRAEAFLREGESADLLGVRVAFVRVVDDTRCPTGASCVVPGAAHAEALVAPAGGPERPVVFGVWTTPDATLVDTAEGPRAVTVVDLAPHPVLDVFRDSEIYRKAVKDGLYEGLPRLGVQVFAVDPAAVSEAPIAPAAAPPQGPSIFDTLAASPDTFRSGSDRPVDVQPAGPGEASSGGEASSSGRPGGVSGAGRASSPAEA